MNVQVPGAFRQVRIEQQQPAGVKVAADMVSLEGWSNESKRAVTRLAQDTNKRLPLVRFALREEPQPAVLRVEVNLGDGPIPGAWLLIALEVIESAVVLVACEAEALRDPELAKLVLAVNGGLNVQSNGKENSSDVH